ncbi:acyl-CoA carboxylase subunit epsilon [Propionibacteriaceae bacterium Y2011]|uniref:acyl-CoA carboxylase subunit epsilon n=1 Tax=Microlunatus sp. Y2014 TaxID=3418488 RepID=UPI003B48DB16
MNGNEPQNLDAPALQVVRGNPTDEELAAITAVLAAVTRRSGSRTPTPDETAVNGWAAHWRRMGATPQHGPGLWRLSAR